MLEAHLNMRPLNRTTRGLLLAEIGKDHLDGCREIIGKLDEMESNLMRATRVPRGTLRIAATDFDSLLWAQQPVEKGPQLHRFHSEPMSGTGQDRAVACGS
jgi:DNA-binding transcriptional LysR family regulator